MDDIYSQYHEVIERKISELKQNKRLHKSKVISYIIMYVAIVIIIIYFGPFFIVNMIALIPIILASIFVDFDFSAVGRGDISPEEADALLPSFMQPLAVGSYIVAVLAVVMFLYFSTRAFIRLLKSPPTLQCPECGAGNIVDRNWICGWCSTENQNSFSLFSGQTVADPCRNCGKTASAFICQNCGTDIALNVHEYESKRDFEHYKRTGVATLKN